MNLHRESVSDMRSRSESVLCPPPFLLGPPPFFFLSLPIPCFCNIRKIVFYRVGPGMSDSIRRANWGAPMHPPIFKRSSLRIRTLIGSDSITINPPRIGVHDIPLQIHAVGFVILEHLEGSECSRRRTIKYQKIGVV